MRATPIGATGSQGGSSPKIQMKYNQGSASVNESESNGWSDRSLTHTTSRGNEGTALKYPNQSRNKNLTKVFLLQNKSVEEGDTEGARRSSIDKGNKDAAQDDVTGQASETRQVESEGLNNFVVQEANQTFTEGGEEFKTEQVAKVTENLDSRSLVVKSMENFVGDPSLVFNAAKRRGIRNRNGNSVFMEPNRNFSGAGKEAKDKAKAKRSRVR